MTPLLTTERFYFFSNTFSLASGLRQLAANDQILIAAAVGFLSLGVPVVKAMVIWIAASPVAQRGPLLVLSERFGKWSMLEVFIAALLIIALKLGPVVDATLHYGAWLLAGSVLLSGLASQFVPHQPHTGPLFSSPVTLTMGAVGGAVAATVLIGALHPDLLRFEAVFGTAETRCMKRVFGLDRLYARTSAAQSDYVANLQSISSDGCPADFQSAFADYVAAWEQLEMLDAGNQGEPTLFERAAARLGFVATRDDGVEDIEGARAEVERVSLEHGVAAPAR